MLFMFFNLWRLRDWLYDKIVTIYYLVIYLLWMWDILSLQGNLINFLIFILKGFERFFPGKGVINNINIIQYIFIIGFFFKIICL